MNYIKRKGYSKLFLWVAFYFAFLIGGCSIFKPVRFDETSKVPISAEKLSLGPFSFQPTIRNFNQKLLPVYKVKVFTLKNRHNAHLTDSIFKYTFGRTELVIYKASGREIFIGGNIYDKNILLKNGVHVGLSRNQFIKCFIDFKQVYQDTVRILSPKSSNKFNFIFKKEKLQAIKIDNYID